MNQIIENLNTPAWWFTGIFFILLGLFIAYLLTKWIPAFYRKLSNKLPHMVNMYLRRSRLQKLRIIHNIRFHPLLVINESVKVQGLVTIFVLVNILVVILYTTTPFINDSWFSNRNLRFTICIIPLYILQFYTMSRMIFLRHLLRSCKKVGSTRFCTELECSRNRKYKLTVTHPASPPPPTPDSAPAPPHPSSRPATTARSESLTSSFSIASIPQHTQHRLE